MCDKREIRIFNRVDGAKSYGSGSSVSDNKSDPDPTCTEWSKENKTDPQSKSTVSGHVKKNGSDPQEKKDPPFQKMDPACKNYINYLLIKIFFLQIVFQNKGSVG